LSGDEPPCSTCPKPKEDLNPANIEAINIWNKCNTYERDSSDMSGTPKRLKTRDIIPLCEVYDLTRDEFEKILMIESIVYPYICKQAKQQQEANKKD
jgi:hypothetical protein